MDFFEFEEVAVDQMHAMTEPHSHDFYELYFLLDGEREFFVENKMFKVGSSTLVVVPPYRVHKTEGGPYKRVNINVSPTLLPDYLNDFLLKISNHIAVKIDNKSFETISHLLSEGAKLQFSPVKNKTDCLLSIAQTIIFILSAHEVMPISASSTAHQPKNVSPEVLKILSYINTNFNQPLSLKLLCDKFYLSKVSLCKKFKSVMHCSIMDYVSRLRLAKAKSLLRDENRSVEDVATECGYSSANYFGLIFKKEVGLSPLNYKKTR
ncbi:MAG: helix-turn-helix domain-containing protein [Clostridiales bacterium]|nr:helix-turn-helix domain-containing protein [Clostridiales bacterium]